MNKERLTCNVHANISWYAALNAVETMSIHGSADDFCLADVRDLRDAANRIESLLLKERKEK